MQNYEIRVFRGTRQLVQGRVKGEWGVDKREEGHYVLTHIPSGYAVARFYQARPAWAVQDRLAWSAYTIKNKAALREKLLEIVEAVEQEMGKRNILKGRLR